ncbi:MAG: hypothetical protein CM15mP103_03100 [Gammaproteobacteria bacterium]|nr:MAG: hypothetical protein CM15mP103_03100 [Gammaproteobacteria bacterium]
MAGAICCVGLLSNRHAAPVLRRTAREFKAAGRPLLGSAPVGVEGTHDWLTHLGNVLNLPKKRIDAAVNAQLSAIRGVLEANPIDARITLSGYEVRS